MNDSWAKIEYWKSVWVLRYTDTRENWNRDGSRIEWALSKRPIRDEESLVGDEVHLIAQEVLDD